MKQAVKPFERCVALGIILPILQVSHAKGTVYVVLPC